MRVLQSIKSANANLAAIGVFLTMFSGMTGKVLAGGSTEWDEGAGTTDWHTAANWDDGVPSITKEAEIGSVGGGTIDIGNTNAAADHLFLQNSATQDWEITGGTATLTLDTDLSGGTGYTVVNESSQTLTVSANISLTNSTAPGGEDSKFFADDGDIDISGNINFNAVDPYFDADSGRTITTSGTLSGTSDVTKTGDGKWIISGSTDNTNSGSTTIDAGTLELGKSAGRDAIAGDLIVNSGGTLLLSAGEGILDSADMTLAGGTFQTTGNSETLNNLTLTSTSVVDLGTGSSTVDFGGSSSSRTGGDFVVQNWSGNFVTGGGTDQIIFGTTLTQTFLDNVDWQDFGRRGAIQLASGEIVPVPEPSTVIGGILILGVIAGDFFRRHRETRRGQADQQ